MADLRPGDQLDTPYSLNKKAKQRTMGILVLLIVGIIGVYFITNRRKEQDAVKKAQVTTEEAVVKDAKKSSGPQGVTGEIETNKKLATEEFSAILAKSEKAKKEQEDERKRLAEEEARKKAARAKKGLPPEEKKNSHLPGNIPPPPPSLAEKGDLENTQGLPPGIAEDGTAGSSTASGGGGNGGGKGPANPTVQQYTVPAYDTTKYMQTSAGVVQPGYLTGAKTPVTSEGHQALEQMYLSSFTSPTTVGMANGESLERVKAGFSKIKGGIGVKPVPHKPIPDPKPELSPEQLKALSEQLQNQGGAK